MAQRVKARRIAHRLDLAEGQTKQVRFGETRLITCLRLGTLQCGSDTRGRRVSALRFTTGVLSVRTQGA